MPVLVVVDMQPVFHAANNRSTIAAVIREIRGEKSRSEPIIVLEYEGSNPNLYDTHESIRRSVERYPLGIIKVKPNDDGSQQVEEGCYELGLQPEAFRLCGVNTSYCVKATAIGLAEQNPNANVEIIAKACGCTDGKDYYWLPNIQKRYKNFSFVE